MFLVKFLLSKVWEERIYAASPQQSYRDDFQLTVLDTKWLSATPQRIQRIGSLMIHLIAKCLNLQRYLAGKRNLTTHKRYYSPACPSH